MLVYLVLVLKFIFMIFGISGSLTLILSEPIINFIKINEIIENTIILFVIRIIIIFPLYQLVLILISSIFGEFNYFISFERNIFKKLFKKLK